MATDWNRLLDYIVRTMVVPNANTEAQLDATAVQDMGDEARAIRENQMDNADRLDTDFARGMDMALQAGGPLVLDDTDPQQGAIVSALARYLVAPDLAQTQSTPVDGGYRYTFEVDWQRLSDVAQRAGVSIPTPGAISQDRG
jgi:hypothetical protein